MTDKPTVAAIAVMLARMGETSTSISTADVLDMERRFIVQTTTLPDGSLVVRLAPRPDARQGDML